MDIEVPANTTSTVKISAASLSVAAESGKSLTGGISVLCVPQA